jgi:hypothetical protein
VNLPGLVTAGNGVLVVIQGKTVGSSGRGNVVVTDLQGKPSVLLGNAFVAETAGTTSSSQIEIFYIPNLAAGSESVTVTVAGNPLFAEISVYEITPLLPVAGIPRFMQIPAVDLGIDGPGGVIGNLPVSHLNNGLNAGSTTFWRGDGSWNPVFYQTVTKAGVAQAQRLNLNVKAGLFVVDNAGTNSTEISNVGTSISLTGQTASIPSAPFHFAQTSALYRANYDLLTTTAGSAGTVSLDLTHDNGGQIVTFTIAVPLDLTTIGDEVSGSVVMWVPVGITVNYATTVVGATGSPDYAVRLRMESLG